jgi:mannose-6-phosphate isomerase-like protein (cupin superfamily)
MKTAAVASRLIDNEKTRVTEWRFALGAATGWHVHGHDYVVVPMLDGDLKLVTAGGAETIVSLKAGIPYFREAGVEHDVINANEFEYVFIEIEIK